MFTPSLSFVLKCFQDDEHFDKIPALIEKLSTMQPNERSSHEVLTAVVAIHVCLVGFQVDSVLFVFLQLFRGGGGEEEIS